MGTRDRHVRAGKDRLLTLTLLTERARRDGSAERSPRTRSSFRIRPDCTRGPRRCWRIWRRVFSRDETATRRPLANARSITSIMALDVGAVQVVHLWRGAGCASGRGKLALIAEGSRRRRLHARARARHDDGRESAPPPRRKSTDPNVLLGVAVFAGTRSRSGLSGAPRNDRGHEEGAGVETERGKLSAAIETAKGQLEALRAQLHAKADPAKAAIFAAHEELIDDPDLLEIVDSAIAKGKSAEFGWKKAVTTHADRLAALRNRFARAARQRSARCRSARARDSHRRGSTRRPIIRRTRFSSPKISRPPTPPRSIARASWDLPRRAAARLRTSRSSRVR